ncbi:MAG TPA: GPR endopeptidase [Clostridia bacterium]|jgi:GPR endopeptidase|nr:GPR endopeptidase [Clostridia bacterium]
MTRVYRELWEGGIASRAKTTEEHVEKKYYGRIAVKYARDEEGSDYITLSVKNDVYNDKALQDRIIEEMIKGIRFFIKKYRLTPDASIMVVGLGNGNITADSLGARVCDRLVVTKHLYDRREIAAKWGCLSCVKPSVSGVTGIDSYEIIKSLISSQKPDMIIAVDTLACGSYARLAANIQMSDDGIEPGRGVGNPKPKLNHKSLKIPVLAIGVPLVIYISKLILSIDPQNSIVIPKELTDLVVTAKEIDFQISDFSYIISESINQSVHFRHKNFEYV